MRELEVVLRPYSPVCIVSVEVCMVWKVERGDIPRCQTSCFYSCSICTVLLSTAQEHYSSNLHHLPSTLPAKTQRSLKQLEASAPGLPRPSGLLYDESELFSRFGTTVTAVSYSNL